MISCFIHQHVLQQDIRHDSKLQHYKSPCSGRRLLLTLSLWPRQKWLLLCSVIA